MRKFDNEPAVPPPNPAVLMACAQVRADKIYNRGCIIPAGVIGNRQLQALLDVRSVRYMPAGTVATAQPQPLPPAARPVQRPAVVAIDDPDPEVAWEKSGMATVAAYIAAGIPEAEARALAREMLMYDVVGKEIWMRAERQRQNRVRASTSSKSLPSTYRSL